MSINDYDEILHARIQDLALDEKSSAYGISMQVIHQGYDSLSGKQRYIYDTEVAPLLREQAEWEEYNRRSGPD
jgi:hypothetical protein